MNDVEGGIKGDVPAGKRCVPGGKKGTNMWLLVTGVLLQLVNDVECGIEGGVPAGRRCVRGKSCKSV